MRKAGNRIILSVLLLLGAFGLMASPAAAAAQTVNCNGVNYAGCYGTALPATVSSGGQIGYNATLKDTTATSVCSTFTATGTGTVSVVFIGGTSQTYSGSGTYCSSARQVLDYARVGREFLRITGLTGSLTFTAVSITVYSPPPVYTP